VTVTRAFVAAGYEVRVSSPKSGKPRGLALDPSTLRVLREHRKRQSIERLAAGDLLRRLRRSSASRPGQQALPGRCPEGGGRADTSSRSSTHPRRSPGDERCSSEACPGAARASLDLDDPRPVRASVPDDAEPSRRRYQGSSRVSGLQRVCRTTEALAPQRCRSGRFIADEPLQRVVVTVTPLRQTRAHP
jgi:hypothetical protein